MLINATIEKITHMPDTRSTSNRVHLRVLLDSEVTYIKTTRTARGLKKTPTGTQRLLIRVFDLPGYSSEILVFPAGENWEPLLDLPMLSRTGSRDVSECLSTMGVNLTCKPRLGAPVVEPKGELRGTLNFM